MSLASILHAALVEAGASGPCPPGAEERVASFWERAAAALPSLELSPRVFFTYVAERLPEEDPWRALSELRGTDLYLACGCARGQAAALQGFERRYQPLLDATLRRFAVSDATLDELRQLVRLHLFVARGDRPPKILEYSGRGELGGWIRVVVTRFALDLSRKKQWEVAADEELFSSLAASQPGPEADYLRALYRNAFKEAFVQAFAALSVQDRNLLRQHYLDGMSLDGLAALHRTHRATAARRLARARAQVLATTRRLLGERIGVDRAGFDSILRLVETQLGATIRRFFDAPAS